MVNPKKEYPQTLFGVIRAEDGYQLAAYGVNPEKRVRLKWIEPPEVLYLVLDRMKVEAYIDVNSEDKTNDKNK